MSAEISEIILHTQDTRLVKHCFHSCYNVIFRSFSCLFFPSSIWSVKMDGKLHLLFPYSWLVWWRDLHLAVYLTGWVILAHFNLSILIIHGFISYFKDLAGVVYFLSSQWVNSYLWASWDSLGTLNPMQQAAFFVEPVLWLIMWRLTYYVSYWKLYIIVAVLKGVKCYHFLN